MSILATSKDRKGKTRRNKKVMAGPCIFPFKYKKDTHEECIEENGERICATEVNPKTLTMTKYGYCESEAQASPVKSRKKSTEKQAPRKYTQAERKERISLWMEKRRKQRRLTLKKKSSSPKKKSSSPKKKSSSPKKKKSSSPKKTVKKRRNLKKRLVIKEPKLSKTEREQLMEELFGTPTSGEWAEILEEGAERPDPEATRQKVHGTLQEQKKRSQRTPGSSRKSSRSSQKSRSPTPSKKLKDTYPSPLKQPTSKPKSKMTKRNRSLKRKLKIVDSQSDLKPATSDTTMSGRLNEKFVKLLAELADIMQRQGERGRELSYRNAADTIMVYPEDITDAEQLKNVPTIGKTIFSKLKTFQETGTLPILERERTNPLNLLTKVYGVGPKKAKELIAKGITTLDQLREHPELLTKNMKIGLEHFEDIEARIPRAEIEEYKKRLTKVFDKSTPPGSSFAIVGSYRRGAADSGDIDIIITNKNDDRAALTGFLDALIADGIVIEVLSRGPTKSLTVARLEPGMRARRVDFMFASPSEYPFSILYFTGSKTFNTIMRQRALDLGYTLNEHGFHRMVEGKKGSKVEGDFPDEKSIFDFLGMEYREPKDRKDTRSMKLLAEPSKPKAAAQASKSVEKKAEVAEPKAQTIKVKKSRRRTVKKQPARSTQSNIDHFKAEGAPYLKTLTEEELSDMIRAANNAYYCDQTPILTDNEYDILRELTLEAFPGNAAADEGHTGCVAVAKDKVTLPYEMWSMDKIKPDTAALGYWKEKYKGPYTLSAKLDGVSGLYSTEGEAPKLYTRGNGVTGQDVSHLIPFLTLPKTKDVVIRGEFIIPKKVFAAKYASKFSNPRNFVAGVVNQKTADAEKYRDIDFVAYEAIRPELAPEAQMEWLTQQDVEVVRFLTEKTVTNELLSEILLDWRADYKYEIDGVICASALAKGPALSKGRYCKTHSKENPENAFAFKMVISDQVAETKVLNVIWTASKHGLLKPRVQVEPVVLGGAKIEYATGFNAKFIEENKIGVGALIQIVRSGDVIPHILTVVQPADKPQMPNVPYEWNDTHVDIRLKGHTEDPVVREKTITAFFKALGVEGLGAGNVRRIIAAGYTTIPEILQMSVEDFMDVEGFKRKSAVKIHDGIAAKLAEVTLPQLMHATNIFGRGFGSRRFEAILSAHPDILVSDETEAEKEAKLAKVHGMAKKSARQFMEELPRFLEWMYDADLESRLEFTKAETMGDPEHPLFGQKIVTTGVGAKEKGVIAAALKKVGAELDTGVKKDTFVVLATNLEEDTEKAEKARKLEIPIKLVEDFMKEYNL